LQSAVRLGPGDFLVLYTDGLSESTNDAGSELGYHGMLSLAESLLLQSGATSSAMGQAPLSAVKDFRGCSPALDDESMVVLQQTMENHASSASQSLESEIWTYEDRAGT
jgi:phosphoserine phosphatase RsbU/P